MTDSGSLTWSPVEWDDPSGGTIRLWPTLPNVVLTPTLRRSVGKWDGVAFLLPEDEPEFWNEQFEQEKSSPGINRDSIITGGGMLARMMLGMSTIDSIQTCKFPDPEFRRLQLAAESDAGSSARPIFFVEPEDEKWTEWVEDCADEMVRIRNLARSIFSGRNWRRSLKQAMRATTPPRNERDDSKAHGFALASALSAAWWHRSEAILSPELCERRDTRLASRLRGALGMLCEGQVDDDDTPVLLVPVMQAWLPSIHAALKNQPLPEHILEEEE